MEIEIESVRKCKMLSKFPDKKISAETLASLLHALIKSMVFCTQIRCVDQTMLHLV